MDKLLIAKYRQLEKIEESLKEQLEESSKLSRTKAMEFSPGPEQIIPTQMKKMMELEIKRRVDDEVKRREEKKPKSSGATTSQSLTRRLFEDDEHAKDDEDTSRYKQRMQKLIEEDEKKRRLEDSKKRDEELRSQKEAWHHEQLRLKSLEEQLQAEKEKNKELEKRWTEAQWEWHHVDSEGLHEVGQSSTKDQRKADEDKQSYRAVT
jgi:hypothetical protein